MKERKSLDRLFQEKFKDFEVSPDEQVWRNIEAALHKKKRRVVPIWWYQVAGVAALLLIGLFAWNSYTDFGVQDPASAPAPTGPAVVNTSDNEDKGGAQTASPSEVTPSGQAKTATGASSSATDAVATSEDGSRPSEVKGTSPKDGRSKMKSRGQNSNATEVASSDEKPEAGDGKTTPKQRNRKSTPEMLNNNTSVATAPSRNRRTQEKRNEAVAAHDRAHKSGAKAVSSEQGTSGTNKQEGLATSTARTKGGNTNDAMAHAPSKQTLPTSVGSTGKDGATTERIAPKTDAAIASIPTDSAKIAEDTKKLEELLQPKNEKEEAIAGTKVDRWQVTTNVAPVYLGSASRAGSAIDPQFASNGKSYNSSTSYGVGVNYALNKRLTVRAGLNKLNLSYNTNDVMFFAAISPPAIAAINPNPTGAFIQVMNPVEAHVGMETFELSIRDENMGTLQQEMGYFEVPLELSYKLLDRRFSISVIGGVSTLFLDQNRLSVLSPGMSAPIGEANNLNSVHYSSNFGIGLRYRFLKSLELHCEPTLKYQINTFSGNDGNFRPYVVGVYSGLSFSF